VRPLGVRTLVHRELSAYSPDGKFLALTEGGGRETWVQKRIALLNISTGSRVFLTSGKEAALFPSWSPSGAMIAYSSGPAESDLAREGAPAKLGRLHLWVMQSDGGQPRQLTSDPAYRDERPRWSADARSILFCRVSAAGAGSVWRIDAAGGRPQQIGDSFPLEDGTFGFYGYTDWSQWVDSTIRLP
jgi:Tol biopolymer transport system component